MAVSKIAFNQKYPAFSFLRRFPDASVQEAVKAAYPGVSFKRDSKDMLAPGDIKRLEGLSIKNRRSLDALSVFRDLEVLEASCWVEDTWEVPSCWENIKEIKLVGESLVHIIFPTKMPSVRTIVLYRMDCKTLVLPTSAPVLEVLDCFESDTPETVYNMRHLPSLKILRGSYGKILCPPAEMPQISFFQKLGMPPLCAHEVSSLSSEIYGKEAIRFNLCNLRDQMKIAHRPHLRELEIFDYPSNKSALESLYLYDLPSLKQLTVEGVATLKDIRFPDWDDGMVVDLPSESQILNGGYEPPSYSGVLIDSCASLDILSFPQKHWFLCAIYVRYCGLKEITLPDILPLAVGLEQNRLTAFSVAGHQPLLRKLDLSDNRIARLSFPAEMPNLQELYLQRNPIPSLPSVSAPELLELHVSYTSLASWRDVPVSHPEKLLSLSARLDDPADLDEIEAAYPNLLEFNPWIEKDMDLTGLFGRWNHKHEYPENYSGIKLHSKKFIHAPDIHCSLPANTEWYDGQIEIDLWGLPAVRNFIRAGFTLHTTDTDDWREAYYTRSECLVNRDHNIATIKHFIREEYDKNVVWGELRFRIREPNSRDSIIYLCRCYISLANN